MSDDWQTALRDAWNELARHSPRMREFRSHRLASTLLLDVYAGLRAADNAPCLLIDGAISPDLLFEAAGMRLGATLGERGPILVLSLEDSDRADLFTTVCADAVNTAEGVPADEGLARFLDRLEAWRRFLRERRAGLSRNETVGLLGELLVFERLLAGRVDLQTSWAAPDDGLHDFEKAGHALEVKTTLGSATAIRISTLDQLDTIGVRRLDLLHIRLVEVSEGRSLGGIVADIEKLLPDSTARRAFANALLRRGLMPDDIAARNTPQIQLRSIVAYAVGESFPRLIRGTVPAAVKEADYALELRAIEEHTVEADAVVAEFIGAGNK